MDPLPALHSAFQLNPLVTGVLIPLLPPHVSQGSLGPEGQDSKLCEMNRAIGSLSHPPSSKQVSHIEKTKAVSGSKPDRI